MENTPAKFGAGPEKLDKTIPVPLYYQLEQILLDRIKSGEYRVGDSIPTEQELCDLFEVSRPTVRQAMGDLVAQGQLQRTKGKGTFVCRPKIEDRFFKTIVTFNQEIRQKNMVPSTRVMNLDIVQNVSAAESLGLDKNARLILLERLRFADNTPMVFISTHLPYEPFKSLMTVDFEVNSLYETLENVMGISIQKVSRIFEAALPGDEEAELLRIDPGQPVCMVTSVASSASMAIEHSVARYRGDLYKFSVDVERH